MHEIYDAEILKHARASMPGVFTNTRLGIIGGGQLAKMTALAALPLGCDVVVLERNNYSPASVLASHSIVGDWENPEALLKLAAQVDVITFENEFVSAEALEVIERCGHRLFPTVATLRAAQDKLKQKQSFAAASLPVVPFQPVERIADLPRIGEELGWPFVLKTCRNGYDGRGNFTLRSEADIGEAWRRLNGVNQLLFAEGFCSFAAELAVIIVRSADGALAEYPVVETVQRDHVCHLVKAPAAISDELTRAATNLARAAVTALDGVGAFGVEMFLTREGGLVINEIAPRVHNSGHYTIEACACSQFENHIRGVLGWPLGSTEMIAPAAAMVNLLGTSKGPGRPRGLERALAVPGAHVHIYGKAMSGPGRKMGHVTALGRGHGEALACAMQAAQEISFGTPQSHRHLACEFLRLDEWN